MRESEAPLFACGPWPCGGVGHVGQPVEAAGYMPNVLLFGTGGVAWEHSSFAGLDAGAGGCPNCRSTSFDQTKDGFVAGGGVDWAPWSNNWIFRLEYLHYQFTGTTSTVFFGATPATFNWGNISIDSVRAGVSYKF